MFIQGFLFLAKKTVKQAPIALFTDIGLNTNGTKKRAGSVCGATRIRTGDTRIFSPLLYQLSYSTLITEAANINTSILSIKEKGIII